jgi:cytochrome c
MRILGFASATLLVWIVLALAALPDVAGGQTVMKKAAPLGIGRAATPEEIRRVDIDVMPDGRGLPPGKGTVSEGAAVYAAKCQSCHGPNGQGGKFERLVGLDPGAKTIGSYWPYATTLYDYTARSMPFLQPGTLTPNEVYSLVAYLLHLNQIVPETAVMDASTLPKVKMPARDKFVKDDRTGGKVVK